MLYTGAKGEGRLKPEGRIGMYGQWGKRLDRVLPFLYFLFAFFLYFSLLSEPYFTDEQDVFYGAYNIVKGKDIYRSFLSQHMPFSYYITALPALFGARTVFQFRLGIYLMLSCLWEGLYLRHRRFFHPVTLFSIPLLYLTVLKSFRLGTTMISDHWQGIGLVLILLELVRYVDSREISSPCAVMVAAGILLSLGTVFASAYSVFCFFLGVAVLQFQDFLRFRKEGGEKLRAAKNRFLREDLRLAAVCMIPFLLLGFWYVLSGNAGNFYEGAYEIVTKVYTRYIGGLGSDPIRVIWETPVQLGIFLLKQIRNLGTAPWPGLLYLLYALALLLFVAVLGRKSPAAGTAALLAAVYGGLRGFDGFHAMAYHALTAAAFSLGLGWMMQKAEAYGRKGKLISGLAACGMAALLLLNFVIWAGYNLLYPQILLDRTPRSEEQILSLLTEPNEEVFACNAPVNSLDVMDLELIPSDACGAISYPYFYEMWGNRQMESIREGRPHVLLYNPEETIWGYVFREYAQDFDAYSRENYTRLPQTEGIWVSGEFLPEALQRLEKAGYGDRVISNGDDQPALRPVKYYAGQTVEARFTAAEETLTAVRLTAACYYRRSNPTLRLTLRDGESGEPVGEGIMTGEGIADNFFSRCPLKAALTPGKQYTLEVLVERIDGKGDMEFYFTPEGELSLAEEYRTGS